MSFYMVNEDLRSIKTKRTLYAALFSLLNNFSFRKITVKLICEEAIVGRATFYSHFIDKYDLLKHCVTELWSKVFHNSNHYGQIEKTINDYVNENTRILKNLFDGADNETFFILYDCILYTANLVVEKSESEELYLKNVVLSNFYAGGIISYLLWQIKNKFPQEVPTMNSDLYDMIHEFQDRKIKA